MQFTDDKLRRIHRRTDGNCHICGRKTYFKNYGKLGARGAWEVEHSVCKANGGSDHGNNLYAAHIACNRAKGTRSSRTARSCYGRTRAPLSKAKKDRARAKNASNGAALGTVAGIAFGPVGMLVGGIVGHSLGKLLDPEAQ